MDCDSHMMATYSEEVPETFGWFGAATHNAQFFEADLITLHVAVAALQGKALTLTKLRDIEALLTKKTLGQLLRTLDESAPVPNEIRRLWEKALTLRNSLSHGFFWNNHSRLMDPTTCRQVAGELRQAALLFNEASEAAQAATENCIALLGIDPLVWQRQLREELARVLGSAPQGA